MEFIEKRSAKDRAQLDKQSAHNVGDLLSFPAEFFLQLVETSAHQFLLGLNPVQVQHRLDVFRVFHEGLARGVHVLAETLDEEPRIDVSSSLRRFKVHGFLEITTLPVKFSENFLRRIRRLVRFHHEVRILSQPGTGWHLLPKTGFGSVDGQRVKFGQLEADWGLYSTLLCICLRFVSVVYDTYRDNYG